jgi:hypothetical protein
MAINYKVLGQAHPAATTTTDLYTVPASTEAIISTMTISNMTSTAGVARVWVRVNGAATAHVNSIMHDVAVAGNSINAFTLGLTIDAGDIVSVRSTNGDDLTFQLFGSEITA